MVTNTVTTAGQYLERGISLFTLSDDNILGSIYATHVHADESFDGYSLFSIVETIIKRSTQIVDKIIQGNQVDVETIDEKPPLSSFSSPLCTLKSIGFELSCKPPGEEIAFKSTLSILDKLSSYTWDAKAVLTLAAFALEYGEFCQLAQLQNSDQLAKSLAILKRVPVVLKPTDLKKRRQGIVELNSLIKATLQVIEIIVELEKLSTYDPKDVRTLASARDNIPVYVFWAIITTVACATRITILTCEEETPHDLSSYAQRIYYIHNKLNIHLINCKKEIEEAETYKRLLKLFQTPTEVMEVIKALIFSKENVQPIIDGSTNKTVAIDVLRRKYVFLFISSLDITDDNINVLKPTYNHSKDNQCSIVWIPIVDQWTDELKEKFKILHVKMPWYVVQYFSRIAGIRFIKEEWHFKGKPIVVVMNPQGKVENPNALHAIGLYGIKPFPFTKQKIETVSNETNWIVPVVSNIDDPNIATWIKEEKYIFFYGGKDDNCIEQFTTKAKSFMADTILMETKISIELVCVGKITEEVNKGRFWTGIEGMFFTKFHYDHQEGDPVTQVQKLLSYRNESVWAVLAKGSTVVVVGHGSTIMKVMEELEEWENLLKEKGFEIAFNEYHSKVVANGGQRCTRLDIPSEADVVLETMKCPECYLIMESFMSYKCCHK